MHILHKISRKPCVCYLWRHTLEQMICPVPGPMIMCLALTCPSPIRACVEADCGSLLEDRHRWLRETGRWWDWSSAVAGSCGAGRIQLHSPLRSSPLWPDGVNQSSPKMSASAQAISDWNKWQMGMLFPLFNQFHQMWFYLL